ncbi:MAG: DUF4363 family protein [Bacillota bacterium]
MWIMLAPLAAFFIIACSGQRYLQVSAEVLYKSLRNVSADVERGAWISAEKEFLVVHQKWMKTRDLWDLIVDHWEIDSIEVSMVRLEQYIRNKNAEDSAAECATLEESLTHIPEKETFSIKSLL